MVCIAFLVGLPLFFEVGFVLLVPIAFTVARRVGVSILMVGLPMVAGLSVVHALVPPHPAAMLAVQAYQASVGQTLLYAIDRHSHRDHRRSAVRQIHRAAHSIAGG
jgi:GntP family gluconate:H+ symporter